MSGPPGIDPALIAACNHRIEEAEERLEISRMRNRHLNRLLVEARSADHLLTRGEVRKVMEEAFTSTVSLVAVGVAAAAYSLVVGDYGLAFFAFIAVGAWTPRAIRLRRNIAAIKRHLKETR